jgi:hypothetical protein
VTNSEWVRKRNEVFMTYLKALSQNWVGDSYKKYEKTPLKVARKSADNLTEY